jgi:hypothetical protein
MRKLLLASAAAMGASMGLVGMASAQTAPALPPGPLSGSFVTAPYGGPGANNNNNYQAAMLPGALANPTPGSFVVRLNAANWFYATIEGSSADRVSPSNTGVPGGSFKVAPYNILEYFRMYPGVDAMATNGLRYGAMTEIRENWSAQGYNAAAPAAASAYNSNSNPSSGFTCTQTLYVRRAFVYLASDKVGIFRFGEGDSVTGTFDNGVTTFQNFDTGGWNGDTPGAVPGNMQATFPWISQQGADYGSNKIVYFSPQFAGFDFGLDWAPNNVNGEAPCSAAGSACPSLSSSNASTSDGARWMNQFRVGARYQGTVGPLAIYGMAAYIGSGHVDYTGAPPPEIGGSTWNGKYNNISAGDVGIALTFAGLTVGGHYLGGQINNVDSTNPQGAPQSQAWLIGVQYATGPFVMGASYYNYQYQGNPSLVHVSQRYTDGLDVGATWNAAPGLYFFAQYLWTQQHQGDFNWVTSTAGGAGGGLENTVQAQVFGIGTKVRW